MDDIKKYRMVFDYHTHTTYSHGKGSMEENVKAAIAKGLRAIAIADHGPGHMGFGIDRKRIPEMRAEIERLRELYPQIEILLGIEANTVKKAPYVDLTEEEAARFDFVMAGFHYGMPYSGSMSNYLSNKIGLFKRKGSSLIVENTAMMMNCVYHNEDRGVHIYALTHPGDKGPFDIEDIAKACCDTGTLLEINNHHEHLSVEDIKIAAGFGVNFIIGSDAHVPDHVGRFETALERALEAGLDLKRIVNIEECE